MGVIFSPLRSFVCVLSIDRVLSCDYCFLTVGGDIEHVLQNVSRMPEISVYIRLFFPIRTKKMASLREDFRSSKKTFTGDEVLAFFNGGDDSSSDSESEMSTITDTVPISDVDDDVNVEQEEDNGTFRSEILQTLRA